MDKAVKTGVLVLLATIVIYSFIGAILIMTNTVIYDDFPIENFTIYSTRQFSLSIKNNAPLTLPFFNPPFFVNLTASNKTVECKISVFKGKMNCGETYIDIGYIEPTKSYQFLFEITPNNQNFTIESNVYSRVLILNIHIGKKIISCTYDEYRKDYWSTEKVYRCKSVF